MQKNTVMFVVFSTVFLLLWYFLFQPKPEQIYQNLNSSDSINQTAVSEQKKEPEIKSEIATKENKIIETSAKESEFVLENDNYKVVFSNKGASVKHWFIREKNGSFVDLVLPEAAPVLGNFPGSVYEVINSSKDEISFEYTSPEGWKIVKTFRMSREYFHKLDIKLFKLKDTAVLPDIDINWGPGLGTDEKELKENESVTRILGLTSSMPAKLEKLKSQNNPAQLYKWVAIDNRYFLSLFMPVNSLNFSNIEVSRKSKKSAPTAILSANVKQDEYEQDFSLNFFVGPKSYTYLKTFNSGFEKTVDFGFFGWLGKIALFVLFFFFKLTNNYGWAIIILTIIIQILVLPLTSKSYKAMAGMKKIQSLIKDLQTKYKNEPQRLQAEMLNLYRTNKVNPLGGCLPMLLQLPIFWALFQTLRNAYELRYSPWILWVKDLSASDSLAYIGGISLNVLPLVMGIGMFLQQKMSTATSDPTQRKMMYIMPIVFTFLFWRFPSGLVLYWLTNSVFSMIVQYFVLKKQETKK
ncbi:membrane protein insertase YidC [Candidatus Ruminimicrobium bovinum]|uniref:membrane protein insertase YidC n=1 Tax=Candidatus Ruminimicrobium bovinum TaxID=3242779 RepID=UPI0039B94AD8